jgi:hypothetical protein
MSRITGGHARRRDKLRQDAALSLWAQNGYPRRSGLPGPLNTVFRKILLAAPTCFADMAVASLTCVTAVPI